jgi:hypothetical protein
MCTPSHQHTTVATRNRLITAAAAYDWDGQGSGNNNDVRFSYGASL